MAARYWVGGGSSSNWNATSNTNWSATSGGANNASVPTSADDVTFDGAGASGNSNSTISSTITVLSLTITSGYTATITHNAVLTIAGNWTYGGTYTISGTSGITISATSTITSNGKTWPNSLTFIGTNTKTLVGNLIISGSLTSGTSATTTINKTTNETITCNGLSALGVISGSSKIILKGGTWSQNSSISTQIDVDIDGNVTFSNSAAGVTFGGTGKTLNYVSGSVITTGSTFGIVANSTITLNTNGIIFNTISFNSGVTITLTSDLSMSNCNSTGGTSCTINSTSSEKINVSNQLFTSTNQLTGTAKINLTGGTWSSNAGVTINNDLDLNGNITISGNVYYSSRILKYVTGTITVTSSTLNLSGSCTLDTNGINWNNITTTNTAGQTFTINSLLSASIITIGTGSSTTFAGTAGFTCATLLNQSTGATTVTLKDGVTYTITSSLSCFTSRVGSILLFTSSHASNKANLVLQNGATCQCLANFTRIDAIGGRPIRSFNGTITDCNNVVSFYDLKTIAA